LPKTTAQKEKERIRKELKENEKEEKRLFFENVVGPRRREEGLRVREELGQSLTTELDSSSKFLMPATETRPRYIIPGFPVIIELLHRNRHCLLAPSMKIISSETTALRQLRSAVSFRPHIYPHHFAVKILPSTLNAF
jgi:hypothetical protein